VPCQLFRHGEVEGLRVGRFPGSIVSSCILYRWGDAVIDTGPPNQWRRVRRFLAERPVRRALVTHHHEDHGGNLARIGRTLGLDTYAPEAARAPLAEGFPLRLYQRVIWGSPLALRAAPLPERLEIAGEPIEALPTPGHSRDLTCFLVPGRGWLFGGDLYITSRPRYLRVDEDLGAMILSLERTLERDFETLFCAHRGVVADGKRALRAKRDFLVALCERVAALDRQGIQAGEIARRLLGDEGLMAWITNFHFSKRALVEACLRRAAGADNVSRG
jgi:glyoxylase-like metal-dependent hydrolase (beta-lactamase superfamily II)